MPRAKTGIIRRKSHKAVLARTKGFRMTKNRLFKVAKEADLHAGQYAFIGRKLRKRDFRSLWITRLSAAVQKVDSALRYSIFMNKVKLAQVNLNRKMLSELAINDFPTFTKIVKKVMSSK